MGYNLEFEDLMDTINTIAQGRGFVNGVDWAKQAQQKGEISWENYKKFQNAHILRVRFSYGNAQDINVSSRTFHVAKDFERKMKASSLRSLFSTGEKTQPKLPCGTYRGHCQQRKRSSRPMKKVFLMEPIYKEIMSVLGHRKPELGGMLGFSLDQNTIDAYVFDAGAKVNEVEYNPNIKYLQSVLDGQWNAKHIFLGGFVHSHPGDFNRLTYADVEYAQRIMDAFNISQLFMPIVTSSYEHKASMTGYIAHRNGRVDRCDIVVVPGENRKELNSDATEEELNPNLSKLNSTR